VADGGEEQRFSSRASVDVHWLHRNGTAPADETKLLKAIADIKLPPGEGYAWVAAEATVAKALRRHLVEERGLSKERVKAAAYWKQGAVACMRLTTTDIFLSWTGRTPLMPANGRSLRTFPKLSCRRPIVSSLIENGWRPARLGASSESGAYRGSERAET